MAWDPALTALRDVLVEVYPTEEDTRQLAVTAGLDLQHITFSAKAINNWTNILTYAHNNAQVGELIRAARSQFGRNPRLAEAERHWLHSQQPPDTSTVMGLAPTSGGRLDPIRLRDLLVDHFNEEELRSLCFDLGFDYDDLPAQGRTGKARELISYLDRRDRLPELVARGKVLRPNASWDQAGLG